MLVITLGPASPGAEMQFHAFSYAAILYCAQRKFFWLLSRHRDNVPECALNPSNFLNSEIFFIICYIYSSPLAVAICEGGSEAVILQYVSWS